jgi:hypothetical protein
MIPRWKTHFSSIWIFLPVQGSLILSFMENVWEISFPMTFRTTHANNQVFGAASPFTPLNPTKTRDIRESKWINQLFKEQYSKSGSFRDDETPTSPFIDNDIDADDIEVANNPNTKMFAISKKQKSKSKTKNAGIGFGLSLTTLLHNLEVMEYPKSGLF